jgi:hypothetical protein
MWSVVIGSKWHADHGSSCGRQKGGEGGGKGLQLATTSKTERVFLAIDMRWQGANQVQESAKVAIICEKGATEQHLL